MPTREAIPCHTDGFVHALISVTVDKGSRTLKVRCGATMPTYRAWDRLVGASGWASEVTCPRCQQEEA